MEYLSFIVQVFNQKLVSQPKLISFCVEVEKENETQLIWVIYGSSNNRSPVIL